jgi:hypothetical protein
MSENTYTMQQTGGQCRIAVLRLLRALVMLVFMGAVIGVLHHRDVMVAGILAFISVFFFWRQVRGRKEPYLKTILFSGMLLTGLLGIQIETWGISNGHWQYHDLPDQRQFAYWLFFAYALAFLFLYRVEVSYIRIFGLKTFRSKLALAAVGSFIFPTWGEIIAINLGTWTYSWEYQFFGVPLLVMFLLMLLHVTVYGLFVLICRSLGIANPVFNIEQGEMFGNEIQQESEENIVTMDGAINNSANETT